MSSSIKDPEFAQAVAGAAALNGDARIAITPAPTPPETLRRRRQAALRSDADNNPLTTLAPVAVEPFEQLTFRGSGLSAATAKALRLGQIASSHALDLHGRTVEQARLDVYEFIEEAQARNLRCVRIVHGRGERGTPQALLKSFVNAWLRELPAVLAFHSAQKRHGGSGALYVLLRAPAPEHSPLPE